METYQILNEMCKTLQEVNDDTTNHVGNVRKTIQHINSLKDKILEGSLTLSDSDLAKLQKTVDDVIDNSIAELNFNIETTHEIEMFQLGAPSSNVIMDLDTSSLIPAEHGIIIQKLWKVEFKDNSKGHMIVSDTSDEALCQVLSAQLSTALATAPLGSVEDLDLTISLSDLRNAAQNSQDISAFFKGFEKPGLVCREIRDIDVDTDPTLSHLSEIQKTQIKTAVSILNNSVTDQEREEAQANLLTVVQEMDIFSTSLGPHPNLEYSDLKRFNLVKDDNSTIKVVASMPVVSWGDDVQGIPLRNPNGLKNKANQSSPGTSYIVDMGGIMPVIRQGFPNPLPATRYFDHGPNGAYDEEGALDRYNGGKVLGLNTTDEAIEIQTLLREKNGVVNLNVPAMSGLWKLDRATFDLGNRHAYYTVFSASRAPPAGFMGVPLAPKQNRLGRGRGEIASGVTLANGVSKTGKTFNNQDTNGAVLVNNQEVPSGLKGLTCDFDGHGMDAKDLLKFLQDNNFVKGTQYLTIPANATLETVEDILIPAGQFVPVITQAVGTLMQFGNGKPVQDGGPSRFQPGLIPFLPGTLAYTPEWHINWIFYNCGDFICDDRTYPITEPALNNTPEEWIRPNHNASFGPPGPSTNNDPESRYNPAVPQLFDPVQLRCKIKWTPCLDYIKKIKGSKDGEISLSMLPQLENENKIFLTEAPGGALRGWVKFLVVNCPLPIIIKTKVLGQAEVEPDAPTTNETEATCVTCTCSRESTMISINGDLNPIWLDEDDQGNDTVIGSRVLNFKVGDHIVIRSTSGTMHGVSLRMDDTEVYTEVDNSKTLAEMQAEVLTEIETLLTVNNKDQLENNISALSDDLIDFHGGIPITFKQKSLNNPVAFPDGVPIADFTPKETSRGKSGTVGCTVHGSSMSFKFTICP